MISEFVERLSEDAVWSGYMEMGLAKRVGGNWNGLKGLAQHAVDRLDVVWSKSNSSVLESL